PSLLLACAVVLSLLAAPHVYSYDLAVLVLPVLVMTGIDRTLGAALAVALSAAQLLDSYLIWTGVHAETLLMVLLIAALLHAVRRRPAADRTHAANPVHAATA
ncbi:MAG: hypothetical protein JOY68_05380, partial [Candidatus Dormibacteraeota bacterium]|nr:hypothetical protein [Candidatus Dormibacteraeota bacterium]